MLWIQLPFYKSYLPLQNDGKLFQVQPFIQTYLLGLPWKFDAWAIFNLLSRVIYFRIFFRSDIMLYKLGAPYQRVICAFYYFQIKLNLCKWLLHKEQTSFNHLIDKKRSLKIREQKDSYQPENPLQFSGSPYFANRFFRTSIRTVPPSEQRKSWTGLSLFAWRYCAVRCSHVPF